MSAELSVANVFRNDLQLGGGGESGTLYSSKPGPGRSGPLNSYWNGNLSTRKNLFLQNR